MGNPKLDVLDLKAIAKIADKHGIPLIVDTMATPSLLNPIEYGTHIVIILTKFIGGQGSSLVVVIDSGTFDWSNGKFPEFTEPSRVSWTEIL